MSDRDDRWQLTWLPMPLKYAVIREFHRVNAKVRDPLYSSLSRMPDHDIATQAGEPSMSIWRLRTAVGLQPHVADQTPREHYTSGSSPWPPEMPAPPRRGCASCAHWGPESDPDYDECCLAGDELLQANAWFIAAGGQEGNPPPDEATGCPHWSPHLDIYRELL